jgi:ribosomal protein L18
MGQATAGSAASAQDVRLQQQGQPTQAEAAQNGTPAAPAAREDKLQKVAADLERQRMHGRGQ